MVSLSERAHLVTLYNEPHRHYHNLEHILHCLRELSSLSETGLITYTQYSVLATALWYHDAVYDPRAASGVNEVESAGLLPFSTDNLPLVAEMIYASQTHTIPEDAPAESHSLFAYFLDIDLAILGQSRSDYDEYARRVRREYSFVPDDAYTEGRKRVLYSFLSRGRIYVSDYFHTKYDEAARENITREMQQLTRNANRERRWVDGLSQDGRRAWTQMQVADALTLVETPGHRMPSEVEKILADEIRRLQSENLEKVD